MWKWFLEQHNGDEWSTRTYRICLDHQHPHSERRSHWSRWNRHDVVLNRLFPLQTDTFPLLSFLICSRHLHDTHNTISTTPYTSYLSHLNPSPNSLLETPIPLLPFSYSCSPFYIVSPSSLTPLSQTLSQLFTFLFFSIVLLPFLPLLLSALFFLTLTHPFCRGVCARSVANRG